MTCVPLDLAIVYIVVPVVVAISLAPDMGNHGSEEVAQVCVQPSVQDRVGDDARHGERVDHEEQNQLNIRLQFGSYAKNQVEFRTWKIEMLIGKTN